MQEYLFHWWAGDLALYYQPLGLSMLQFNKCIKIGQYLFGLLGLFELVQFSTIMRQLHFVSVSYLVLNRMIWHTLNVSVTLAPKLITGVVALSSRSISLGDLLRSIILPHVQIELHQVHGEARKAKMAKLFQWLADHPLNDNYRRFVVFGAFAVFSLADILSY